MTSFAAAELRARQRLRERSDAEAPSSSLCARHERLKCSVAALSAFALRCGTAKFHKLLAFLVPYRPLAQSRFPTVYIRNQASS